MRRLLVTMAAVLLAADVASAGVLAHRRAHFRGGATVDAYVDFASKLSVYWAFEAGAGVAQPDYAGVNHLGADADATQETGKRGYGYGVTSAVAALAGDAADTQPTSGWALSAWVYVDTSSNGDGLFIGKGSSGPYYLSLHDVGADGVFRFCANTRESDGDAHTAQTADAYVEDTWYHVVGIADATLVRLYVDGAQVDSAAYDHTFIDNATQFTLAGFSTADAVVDEVSYWNDISFASTEQRQAFVTDLYAAGAGHFLGDTRTVLLLHGGDGKTDAGTADWDYSFDPHALTFGGNAQTDTALHAFAADKSSFLFDGTADYVEAPDSADFDLGTGDYTIEAWVRFDLAEANDAILSQTADTNNRWQLYMAGSSLVFYVKLGALDKTDIEAAWNPSATTWYHVAVSRVSGVVAFYVNGTALSLGVNTGPAESITGVAGTLRVGGMSGSAYDWDGNIDEVRITKGAARYTGAFTSPTTRFRE